MSDITLVNPPVSNNPSNHPVPYGLWQLGSYINSHGFTSSILDLNFCWRTQKTSIGQLQQLLQNIDSPVIGFTCMGNNLPTALELAIDLKVARPDILILFGGPQASLVGPDLLTAFQCIDYVVVGEGEWTLLEILNTLKDGMPIDGIPGVLGRDGNFVPRKLMPTLDDMPYPNLSLINWENYLPNDERDAVSFPILAGSGCPFQCTFCSTSVMWKRYFRVKTPKRLAQEMLWLSSETGHNQFDLIHDIFTANRRFLREFCSETQNLNIKWQCSSRIDGLSEVDIRMMALSKCSGIFFGVESGSQRIQQIIGKRLKVENIRPTLGNCVKNQVDCVCSTIFGFPQETWKDIEATVQLCLDARQMGVGRANLHMLMALPGTQTFRESGLSKTIEDRDLNRSGLPIFTDRARHIIKNNPTLCSAFYWVEHPNITKDEMFSLSHLDGYLATHPQTLATTLNSESNSLSKTLADFSKLGLESQFQPLSKFVNRSANSELLEIHQEEALQNMLLNEYKQLKSQGITEIYSWMTCKPDGTMLVYEVMPDAVTVNVYELYDEELSEWERISYDDYKKTGVNINHTSQYWPVKQKEKIYETHQNGSHYS